MMTIYELSQKWSRIGHHSDQRIDADHPIDIYTGINMSNQKELLILSNEEPKAKITSSQSISVEIRKRADTRFAIIFTLIQEIQEPVFINLVHDLIESSRKQSNDKRGISFIIDRYFKWQQLLEDGRDNLLSDSIIKGLIGELLFLEHLIDSDTEIGMAVSGWVGIDKADRDFILPHGWYEIKSVNPAAYSVHISSLEQLDVVEDGELVVYFIEKSIESEKNSFHIIDLIDRLRSKLILDPIVLSDFNFKLRKFGFIDRSEYLNKYYVYRNQKRFLVNHQFPRIRKSEISTAVCMLSYDLSLGSLSQWEIPMS
ncbi:PD-(D/E)XK motif protein [Paenibacillus frigoriresistens]|uniref:PD-(D/E)XK motif protein n=1 Tax=Paenibacillus alginolyticus TaxID=59839 RepID=UPI00156310A9|nr:PD-(D/E)XK motif protein [Paenibacillus frigoriresistens]NRF96201.1 PD-(D/E)XK motif protein [Paenibacillus frigoriresistens]